MKPSRPALFTASAAVFLLDFLYLVIRGALSAKGSGADVLHFLLLAAGYTTFTIGFLQHRSPEESNPIRLITRLAAVTLSLAAGWILISLAGAVDFRSAGDALLPASKSASLFSIIAGIGAGLAAIVLFATSSELVFVKRRRSTRRNYFLLVAGIAIALLLDLNSSGGMSLLPRGLYAGWMVLLVVAMLVNSFRFAWVLVLTRREKYLNLALSGVTFILLLVILSAMNLLDGAAAYYHPLVASFARLVLVFCSIYMCIGFFSTLLHLPTAKEFDRRREEMSSLQTMSRLMTQVFDTEELLSTAAQTAGAMCQGAGAWIELDQRFDGETADGGAAPVLRASADLPPALLPALRTTDGQTLQQIVIDSGKPIIIQDCPKDRRIPVEYREPPAFGSCALFPLTAHGRTIGLLGVAKKTTYEFDTDLQGVMSAFSDLVSVALENNRLISSSLRRERFEQELSVARTMQNSLLPSLFPLAATYDIAARSLPAYEVGGDYFDMVTVNDDRAGIAVGDVSGKGISAALYMAEMKGIFHSLSPHFDSPHDVLLRMNATLCRTMDRRCFISLLFALLNTRTGVLRYARAGHCPLLYISGGSARFLRPSGMGLGLDASPRFGESIVVEELLLQPGDLVVLFTDGVTEARNNRGEEFAEQRLADAVLACGNASADAVIGAVLDAVHGHSGNAEAADDRTVLALRWHGARTPANDASNDSNARPEGAT